MEEAADATAGNEGTKTGGRAQRDNGAAPNEKTTRPTTEGTTKPQAPPADQYGRRTAR